MSPRRRVRVYLELGDVQTVACLAGNGLPTRGVLFSATRAFCFVGYFHPSPA